MTGRNLGRGRSGLLRLTLTLAVALGPAVWVSSWYAPRRSVVCKVAYSADGATIATVSDPPGDLIEHELRVWDSASGRERRAERRRFPAELLRVSADGKTIRVNTPEGPRPLSEFAGWPGRLLLAWGNFSRYTLSHDGRVLATTQLRDDPYPSTRVRLWDVATGAPLGELDDGEPTDALAFTPDGSTLAGVAWRLVLWDVASRKVKTPPAIASPSVKPLAVSPDGSAVLAQPVRTTGPGMAMPATGLTAWDVNTGAALATLPASGMVAAYSPDGRRVAVANNDVVSVYEPPSPVPVATFRGHVVPARVQALRAVSMHAVGNAVWGLAFSPDGREVASADTEGDVRVWDSANGRERLAFAHASGGAPGWALVAAWVWAACVVGGASAGPFLRNRAATRPWKTGARVAQWAAVRA